MDDVLGQVLEQTQLRGHVYCETVACAPWGLRFGARSEALFHVVTDGACWVVAGRRKQQLAAGDVLVVPRGIPHALSDDPRTPLVELEEWLADPSLLRSQGGSRTRVLCGAYRFGVAGPNHPVLRLLPELVYLSGDQTRRRPDLAATLASLVREHETAAAGNSLVIARLLDVLFVQLLRAWVDAQPAGAAGWLGALRDSSLARALAALHEDLTHAWTVERLARVAGTSRATLARRFVAEVGESPLAYLGRARMQNAAHRLRTTDESLATVARSVGYASEFAFNRAFRRELGTPPGRYRDQVRQATGSGERIPSARRRIG